MAVKDDTHGTRKEALRVQPRVRFIGALQESPPSRARSRRDAGSAGSRCAGSFPASGLLGFPSRGLIEGVSLTVTTGVVTRFNRGPQGEVASIYVDAAFTHGSSGGPSVSLVTGGVIGLNSFGMDVQLDARSAGLNDFIK